MNGSFELDPAMVKRYLDRRGADLESITAALSERRFEVISNLGHQWKGNAENFGFPQLAHFGRNLESAADASDVNRITSLIGEVRVYVADQVNLFTGSA